MLRGRPHDEVEPDRRLVGELDPEGEGHHHDADERHHEEGGAVARIGEGEIEAADLAFRPHLQEALEQMPLAAAGA